MRRLVYGFLITTTILALAFTVVDRFYPWTFYPARLAIHLGKSRTDEGIYTFDVRLNTFTRLTPDDTIVFSGPVWSPDGNSLAYFVYGGSSGSEIGIVDVGGDAVKRFSPVVSGGENLYLHPIENDALAWSPDSRYILFSAYSQGQDGAEEEKFYLLDVSTGLSEVVDLPSLPLAKPRSLNFAWAASGPLAIEVDGKIYLVDISTHTATFFVDGRRPFWHPNGKELAFFCFDNNVRGLCSIELAEGNSKRMLEEDIEGGRGICWTADGRFIAYLDSGGESDPIYLALWDARTGQTHRIYKTDWRDRQIMEQLACAPK